MKLCARDGLKLANAAVESPGDSLTLCSPAARPSLELRPLSPTGPFVASPGPHRDCEAKGGAVAHLGLHPDASSVAFDDSLADRQAHARARVLVAPVQAVEDLEDSPGMFRSDADAVVPDGEDPGLVLPLCTDVNPGGPSFVNLIALPSRFWNTWTRPV